VVWGWNGEGGRGLVWVAADTATTESVRHCQDNSRLKVSVYGAVDPNHRLTNTITPRPTVSETRLPSLTTYLHQHTNLSRSANPNPFSPWIISPGNHGQRGLNRPDQSRFTYHPHSELTAWPLSEQSWLTASRNLNSSQTLPLSRLSSYRRSSLNFLRRPNCTLPYTGRPAQPSRPTTISLAWTSKTTTSQVQVLHHYRRQHMHPDHKF